MYCFTRTVTLKNATIAPKAIGFSMELTGYLNKTYGMNIRCGMELFGGHQIHWQFDIDSLDKISALNQKIVEDKNYNAVLEKGTEFWLPGSLKDCIVMYPTA
jgi:hypothetical protein